MRDINDLFDVISIDDFSDLLRGDGLLNFVCKTCVLLFIFYTFSATLMCDSISCLSQYWVARYLYSKGNDINQPTKKSRNTNYFLNYYLLFLLAGIAIRR